MTAFTEQRVLDVHHWTERLFSFTTSRDRALRFASGQFTMIGLQVDGRRLVRAYSIASAHYEEHLEFLSIKVPDGPLTSRLQHLRPGDSVIVGRKPTGTLVADHLVDGERLWLLATGTGLAPFLSIVRDPQTFERFGSVVLVHGVRTVDELAYHDYLQDQLPRHEWLGDQVAGQLLYHPMVTREPFRHQGRITGALVEGRLCADLGIPPLDARTDRAMVCGSPPMLADLRAILEARGFQEGSAARPGHYVVERAFVDR